MMNFKFGEEIFHAFHSKKEITNNGLHSFGYHKIKKYVISICWKGIYRMRIISCIGSKFTRKFKRHKKNCHGQEKTNTTKIMNKLLNPDTKNIY